MSKNKDTMPNSTEWLWKSDKGNIYIHCDDILSVAQSLGIEEEK